MSKCKGETTVWSRVTGYFQVLSQWNPGKKVEFEDRKMYEVGKLDLADEEGKKRLLEDEE